MMVKTMMMIQFALLLLALPLSGSSNDINTQRKDILETYYSFKRSPSSSFSLRRRTEQRSTIYEESTEEEERVRYDLTQREVEGFFERYPERRQLDSDDYYDCTGYTRPEILSKFMGIPTTTTITNATTYAVTLEADVERTGNYFFSSDSELESWTIIQYGGENISILDCGFIKDCRENTMTNYFRFSGKSDTDIFPRVDQILSVTNSTIQVLISSTTENAGPLVMSFMYDNTNSTNLCYWTPYQVVAWITASNPSITGIVQGGVSSNITDYSDYVINKGTRTSGSPTGNWLYSDSQKLTILGTNFATSAASNLIRLANNAQWSASKSSKSYRECSRDQETWTPDPTYISATSSSASDDGTWVVVDFDNLDAMNGGINYNALLYDTDNSNIAGSISSILCSESNDTNASVIGDLDWSTFLSLSLSSLQL